MGDPPPRRTSKRRPAPSSLVTGSNKDGTSDGDDSNHQQHHKKQHPPPHKKKRSGSTSEGGGTKSVESSRAPSPADDDAAAAEDPMEYLRSLAPLPAAVPRVTRLTPAEVEELERVLEFRAPGAEDGWRQDWAGNLALAEKDILNPSVKGSTGGSGAGSTKNTRSFRQPLILWAVNSKANVRLLRNLLRYVCTMDRVPTAVKKLLLGNGSGLGSSPSILTTTSTTVVDELIRRIRRASYDPQVLAEDGWTTERSDQPVGATGGPHLIGDKIRCDGADAVVIAYVHDPDIGDLWKALWMEDLISFDLEAEELLEAKRKYERRYNALDGGGKSRRSARISVSSDFTVKGIEYGIVLSASYSKGARPGVYWPARVMHASEGGTTNNQGRRNSSKQKVDLVFLAPYWSSDEQTSGKARRVESMSEGGQSRFEANPLLLLETIDASDEMIKEYPYSTANGLDVAQLQMSFRFTGLPKSAFSRYLDAHRLAMGLREYAKGHLKTQNTATDKASAGLFETHPMSVHAPTFPSVVLHLPFDYILMQLPRDGDKEPVLKLNEIINSMKPPFCWGEGGANNSAVACSTPMKPAQSEDSSPAAWLRRSGVDDSGNETSAVEGFMTTFPLLNQNFNRFGSSPPLVGVLSCLTRLLAQLAEEEEASIGELSVIVRKSKLCALITSWTILKKLGEESLSALLGNSSAESVMMEWRQAVEKIYKYIVGMFSDGKTLGNGLSAVVTDTRCNSHRTTTGCFERPVRLPAALKAAKMAGAGRDETTRLITSVPDQYVDLVEQKLLQKTHDAKYLKRMKSKCAAAKSDDEVLVLTDGSDGEGGEDTRGSRGTWKAAVTGVAAAVFGADMVVRGECVNVFCVTRPPGHHAGRSLHPMKAVSNGFCILNSVACAALYATTPILEGGLGLSRVCVIDFDVHHGNGTQDILCSTFDPRFLYVSLHAGGAEVNGHAMEDDPKHELHDLGSNPKMSGIYPGRCGDTSPHMGVLNIPLGAKVTSHSVGTALINLVSRRVENFAPDLIILSAGFDAHKSDPMGLGGLRAEDFGHITQVACQIAVKSCSGRVLSVMEGGYGVPCCRPQKDIFLPQSAATQETSQTIVKSEPKPATAIAASKDIFLPQSAVTQETSQTIVQSEPKPATAITAPESVLEQPQQATSNGNGSLNHATESSSQNKDDIAPSDSTSAVAPPVQRPQPSKLLDLADDLPADMDDQVPYALQCRLEKCHAEGFVECVFEHVQALARGSKLGTG